ncbi:MAG: ABC transporter ATP-binding protein, partial [Frankiaceae bacterium]|nr:ABC transporter ATP-binding protein [Frankiaceae bacterium]
DVYAVLDGELRHLPGGVDEYLSLRRAVAVSSESSTSRSEPRGDSRAARKELARIERRLSRIASEEAALYESMAAVATDHEQVLALDAKLRALATEKAELEEQWLMLADDVD